VAMEWPYHFVDLTQEQNHDRRKLIDRYGIYSQLSALIPIALYQLYRLAGWVHRERQRSKIVYTAVPSSPDLKKRRTSRLGKVRTQWRSFVWWLGGEIVTGYGKRGHWIATVIWLCWLLFLSIHRTGDGKPARAVDGDVNLAFSVANISDLHSFTQFLLTYCRLPTRH